MKTRYKHIHFEELPENELALLWKCLNNTSFFTLGVITFYKPWKQYVMQFADECVFNNQCLRDIAEFMDQLNATKNQRKSAEPASKNEK